jgi:hypothetical protein
MIGLRIANQQNQPTSIWSLNIFHNLKVGDGLCSVRSSHDECGTDAKCQHSLAHVQKSWPEISKFDVYEAEADRQRSRPIVAWSCWK